MLWYTRNIGGSKRQQQRVSKRPAAPSQLSLQVENPWGRDLLAGNNETTALLLVGLERDLDRQGLLGIDGLRAHGDHEARIVHLQSELCRLVERIAELNRDRLAVSDLVRTLRLRRLCETCKHRLVLATTRSGDHQHGSYRGLILRAQARWLIANAQLQLLRQIIVVARSRIDRQILQDEVCDRALVARCDLDPSFVVHRHLRKMLELEKVGRRSAEGCLQRERPLQPSRRGSPPHGIGVDAQLVTLQSYLRISIALLHRSEKKVDRSFAFCRHLQFLAESNVRMRGCADEFGRLA
mmetsp:Transcript_79957/g.259095  ORF Transcript_79957/g.259095 Transcript_79957/m.259095 type:complete len:296 (-) Transcript_79957:10678-11565(-)